VLYIHTYIYGLFLLAQASEDPGVCAASAFGC
jgi:hypothetical protein